MNEWTLPDGMSYNDVLHAVDSLDMYHEYMWSASNSLIEQVMGMNVILEVVRRSLASHVLPVRFLIKPQFHCHFHFLSFFIVLYTGFQYTKS